MTSAAPGRVLILGWAGSRPSQLAPLAEWYRMRGLAAEVVVPSVAVGMSLPSLLAVRALALAERVAKGNGPLLIHMFSNNGFITAGLLLEQLVHAQAQSCVAGLVLDSCPSALSDVDAEALAELFARGLVPMVAARLGLSAAAGQRGRAWMKRLVRRYFAARPGLCRALASAPGRFVASRPKVPMLCVYGERDEVVRAEDVRAFVQRERAAGLVVRELGFADEGHVSAMFRKRKAYSGALDALLQEIGLVKGGSAAA